MREPGARLFTDHERAEMGRPTFDKLIEALDRGDIEGARTQATRMHAEQSAMHDLYRDKAAALQSHIAETFGEPALEAALVASARKWWLPILAKMPKGREGLKKRIKMYVAGLRGHLQPIEVLEDDAKVTLRMRPCGSGGRLVLEGRYAGKEALYTIRTPSTMTYGRSDYPAYCAHEASMEALDIEANGTPMMVVEPARNIGAEPCSFFLYKDPADIPPGYYARLGLPIPDDANASTRW